MAKTYECVPDKVNEQFCWGIRENATGYILQRYAFEEDALLHARKLKGGCGFAGNTPTFFFNNDSKSVKTTFSL